MVNWDSSNRPQEPDFGMVYQPCLMLLLLKVRLLLRMVMLLQLLVAVAVGEMVLLQRVDEISSVIATLDEIIQMIGTWVMMMMRKRNPLITSSIR